MSPPRALYRAVLVVLLPLVAGVLLGQGRAREHDAQRQSLPSHEGRPAAGVNQSPSDPTLLEAAVKALEEQRQIEAWDRLMAALAAASQRARAEQQAIPPDGCPYAAQIRAAFPEDPDWAVTTAWRESRCQPDARNVEGASGLFQMMMPLHRQLVADACGTADPDAAVFDPACNIAAAHALYAGSGRAPWGG